MESNRATNNQMALKGVVLVLALIAAGAFVLARGLNDDPAPAATEATPTAAAEAAEAPPPAETPPDGEGAEADPTAVPDTEDASTAAPDESTSAETSAEPPYEVQCRDPSTISVLVANGTDVNGAAGRLSGELNAANYVTEAPRNATPQTSSAFYYRAGYEDDAQCIANLLGAGAGPLFVMSDPPPGGISLDDLGNAYVLVLIGPDSLAQRPG